LLGNVLKDSGQKHLQLPAPWAAIHPEQKSSLVTTSRAWPFWTRSVMKRRKHDVTRKLTIIGLDTVATDVTLPVAAAPLNNPAEWIEYPQSWRDTMSICNNVLGCAG